LRKLNGAQHGDDAMKKQQATMRFIVKQGVNPLSAVVYQMLIQIAYSDCEFKFFPASN